MSKSEYRPTIGLEIHAELATKSKMFCSCVNNPDETKPNTNVCPVCLGQPGTLPVLNHEAIRQVLRVGVAAGGILADFTEWDRKNYFYPDIPKNYQISQYKYPLVSGGEIAGVELTRIHLEEDTATSKHHAEHSQVDFNRAGVPLMELVTEPVIHDAETAGAFARELQLLLRYLGAGEANLEKGEMRVEANISVSKTDEFGTKTEVKNLNSFKAVERAIAFEIERQIALLETGERVKQETRGWDENKQKTFSQRSKEAAHDYRYFPDPDIPKLKLSEMPEFAEAILKESLPELPWERRARFEALGAGKDQLDVLVPSLEYATYLDQVNTLAENSPELLRLAINYLTSDINGLLAMKPALTLPSAKHFVSLLKMIEAGELSSRGAKDVLVLMLENDTEPEKLAAEHGLLQQSDEGALEAMVETVISENPEQVAEYQAGNDKLLQYFIGQGMKLSKGSANPGLLAKLFTKKLKA